MNIKNIARYVICLSLIPNTYITSGGGGSKIIPAEPIEKPAKKKKTTLLSNSVEIAIEGVTKNREELTKSIVKDVLPPLEKTGKNLGRNAGLEAVKVIDALARDGGEKALYVAAAATALYATDQAIKRNFPDPQKKAEWAEAELKTFAAKTALEDMQKLRQEEQAFGQCLHAHPRMIRDPFGVPGVCRPLARKLSIFGGEETVAKMVTALHKLDTEEVPRMSPAQAEKELREAFKANMQGSMFRLPIAPSKPVKGWFWSSPAEEQECIIPILSTIECPSASLIPLKRLTALDASRSASVWGELMQEKYPSKRLSTTVVLDKTNKYPELIRVHQQDK